MYRRKHKPAGKSISEPDPNCESAKYVTPFTEWRLRWLPAVQTQHRLSHSHGPMQFQGIRISCQHKSGKTGLKSNTESNLLQRTNPVQIHCRWPVHSSNRFSFSGILNKNRIGLEHSPYPAIVVIRKAVTWVRQHRSSRAGADLNVVPHTISRSCITSYPVPPNITEDHFVPQKVLQESPEQNWGLEKVTIYLGYKSATGFTCQ